MTQKYLIAIADLLSNSRLSKKDKARLVEQFADYIETQNPRFKRDLFIREATK